MSCSDTRGGWLVIGLWAGLVGACSSARGLATDESVLDTRAPLEAAEFHSIEGPGAPCFGSTSRYQYCPGSNFPYHWWWTVQGSGASMVNLGTGDNCYHAEVTVADSPATLTFHQRNPVGVPQVYDVRKHIAPRECEVE